MTPISDHDLERVDRFLHGALTAEEAKLFLEEADRCPDIAEAIDDAQAIEALGVRAGMDLEQILAATPASRSSAPAKLTLVGSALIGGMAAAALMWLAPSASHPEQTRLTTEVAVLELNFNQHAYNEMLGLDGSYLPKGHPNSRSADIGPQGFPSPGEYEAAVLQAERRRFEVAQHGWTPPRSRRFVIPIRPAADSHPLVIALHDDAEGALIPTGGLVHVHSGPAIPAGQMAFLPRPPVHANQESIAHDRVQFDLGFNIDPAATTWVTLVALRSAAIDASAQANLKAHLAALDSLVSEQQSIVDWLKAEGCTVYEVEVFREVEEGSDPAVLRARRVD